MRARITRMTMMIIRMCNSIASIMGIGEVNRIRRFSPFQQGTAGHLLEDFGQLRCFGNIDSATWKRFTFVIGSTRHCGGPYARIVDTPLFGFTTVTGFNMTLPTMLPGICKVRDDPTCYLMTIEYRQST